jgi:hypothetical protein
VKGEWDEKTAGGNTSLKTWVNNPKHKLEVKEDNVELFISLSQDDPRGKAGDAIMPIAFHIVQGDPHAIKPGYWQDPEHNTIPGSRHGGDLDGTPQGPLPVPYTFKQAMSSSMTLKKGTYYIVPSMYHRIVPKANKTATGKYFLSVYYDCMEVTLEGGRIILEEEDPPGSSYDSRSSSADPRHEAGAETAALSAKEMGGSEFSKQTPEAAKMAAKKKKEADKWAEIYRQFEDVKLDLMSQAASLGIGLRQVRALFNARGGQGRSRGVGASIDSTSSGGSSMAKGFNGSNGSGAAIPKAEFKRLLMRLGFHMSDLPDQKLEKLMRGMDEDRYGATRIYVCARF